MNQRVPKVAFAGQAHFLKRNTRGLFVAPHLVCDRLPRVRDGPLRLGGWTGKGRLLANLMLLLHAPCLGLGLDDRVFQPPHTVRMSKRAGGAAPAAVAVPASSLDLPNSTFTPSTTDLIVILILIRFLEG